MERRTAIELRKASRSKLAGYAAVFNSPSEDLGGFTETIRVGAFRRSLLEKSDVLALYNHDTRLVLGRSSAGTLTLQEDARGLSFEIDMPDTSTARDLMVSVGRGDIRGASFAFKVKEERWLQSDTGVIRELLDVDLFDVTITATPAYPDTGIAKRSMPFAKSSRLALASRYLEIMAGAQ
jgi:uncharacterized protein